MKPKISILIVSWNCEEFLRNTLKSIYDETKDVAFETIVIDNASSDGTAIMMEKEFQKVKFIGNKENMGCARASNQGIRESKGEYILLVNPDILILNDVIEKMMNFMDNHPNAGMVTCKILNPDKTFQTCYADFPSLSTIVFGGSRLGSALHSVFLTKKFFKHAGLSEDEYNQAHKVDWIMGTFMMVRRKAIEQAGMFDENLFMYGEEPDWCYRISRHGWEIWYVPEGETIHFGARSTEKVPTKKTVDWLLRTRYYFFLKHYSKPKMVISHLTGLISAMIKLSIFRILSLLPLNPKRNDYIKGKLSVFTYEVKWHFQNRINKLSMSLKEKQQE